MSKIIGSQCTDVCTPHNVISNLYNCDRHGEFYYWPKLTNSDISKLGEMLEGNKS
jgi:hypothetical protein